MCIAATILGLSVSVLVCAVAWLFYRPRVSLALVVCALVPLYLMPRRPVGVAPNGYGSHNGHNGHNGNYGGLRGGSGRRLGGVADADYEDDAPGAHHRERQD